MERSTRPAGLLIAIGAKPKKMGMHGIKSSDSSGELPPEEKTDEVRDLLGQAYDAAQEKDKEGFVDLLVSAIKSCCSEYMEPDEDDEDSEED